MVPYSYSLSVYIHNGVRGQNCCECEVNGCDGCGPNQITTWVRARCHRARVRTGNLLSRCQQQGAGQTTAPFSHLDGVMASYYQSHIVVMCWTSHISFLVSCSYVEKIKQTILHVLTSISCTQLHKNHTQHAKSKQIITSTKAGERM